MQLIKCNLCGSEDYELLYKSDVTTVICRTCGLVFVNPVPDKDYVEKFNANPERQHFKEDEESNKKIAEEVYSFITRFINKGDILEIGCWNAYILELFRVNGWGVGGIEPNPTAQCPSYVLKGFFPDVKPNKKFDVILFRHTLEHMPNPMLVLKEAKSLLKKNGILAVITPSIAHPRGRFYNMFHGERLFFFSPTTLFSMFSMNGYTQQNSEIKKGKIYAIAINYDDSSVLVTDNYKKIKNIVKYYKFWYYIKGAFIIRRIIYLILLLKKMGL